MRKVAFLPPGFEEFNQWAIEDKKIYVKIVTLIKDIQLLQTYPRLTPMTLKQQLLQEIEHIPDPLLPQILQFIQTLKPQQPQPSVKLKQTWAGAMKNYRDQYTALELQQETVNQWTEECIS